MEHVTLRFVKGRGCPTKEKQKRRRDPSSSPRHLTQHQCKHTQLGNKLKERKEMCPCTKNSKGLISRALIYISSQGLFFCRTNSWSCAYRSSIFIRMENESSRNTARRFIVYAVCGQVQIGNQLSN